MGMPEEEQGNVMHSQLLVNDTFVIMAADVPSHMNGEFTNGTQSVSGDDLDTLRGWYDAIGADGGTVNMPFEKAPWGDHFGQVTDRFGISWMFNAAGGGE